MEIERDRHTNEGKKRVSHWSWWCKAGLSLFWVIFSSPFLGERERKSNRKRQSYKRGIEKSEKPLLVADGVESVWAYSGSSPARSAWAPAADSAGSTDPRRRSAFCNQNDPILVMHWLLPDILKGSLWKKWAEDTNYYFSDSNQEWNPWLQMPCIHYWP